MIVIRTAIEFILLAGLVMGIALSAPADPLTRHALPLLPYAVVHFAALRRPAPFPSWLAFATGLAIDFVTHGPLGYWALVYLAGLFVINSAPSGWSMYRLGRSATTIVTIALLILLQAGVSSLYMMHLADVRPVALAGAGAAGVLVLLEWLLPNPVERVRGYGADAATLQRGE